jgi:hypothetical protein
MQGQPAGLVQSGQEALAKMGVRVRRCTVKAVKEGRPCAHKDIGKKLTLELPEGTTLTESTDLVLWTAGPFILVLSQVSDPRHRSVRVTFS